MKPTPSRFDNRFYKLLQRTKSAIRPSFCLYRLVLAGVLLIGFSLRIWQLGDAPLWVDETFTTWAARNFLEGQGFSDVVGPSSPYRRAWLTTTLPISTLFFGVGFTEFAARFPSALFGTVTILVVYLLGAQYHRHVGLVVATLAALDPFMIVWAREARMYAHLQLIYVLGVYFLYRWRVVDQLAFRSRYIVGLALVVGLGINTHRAFLAFGAVFLVFMILVIVNQIGGQESQPFSGGKRTHLLARATILFACGIAAAVVFIALNGIPDVLTSEAPGQWPERDYLFYWHLLSDHYSLVWVLGLAGFVYLLLGYEQDQLLAYAFIIPFLVASVTAVKAPRYVYHLLPLLFCAAVIPVAEISRRLIRFTSHNTDRLDHLEARRLGVALFLIFILVVTPPTATVAATDWTHDSPFHPGQSSFDEVSEFVEGHDDGSGIIMSTRPEVSMWYLGQTDYFFRQHGIKYAEPEGEDLLHTRSGTIVVTDPSVVHNAMEEERPIWLLAGQRFHQGFTSPEMRNYVGNTFVSISDESWHNMELYYWSPYITQLSFDTKRDIDHVEGNVFVFEDGDNNVLALGRTVETPAIDGSQGESAYGEATFSVAVREDRPIYIETRTFGVGDGERYVEVSVSTDGEDWETVDRNANGEWRTNRVKLDADVAESDELFVRLEGGTENNHRWGGLVDYIHVVSLDDWEEEYIAPDGET